MTTPTKREARRYERRGILAVDPRAFFDLFLMPEAAPVNDERREATIVTIRGPLEQHAGGWCDSYESILQRAALACEANAPAIVLRIDSPGGDAQGCFDCARELRGMAAAARKTLYAFVEGHGCSAAYAIACASSHIALGDTATVGSIGVLSTRDDFSQANAMKGIRTAFIASGSRKSYGHPDSPLTEDEVADTQAVVDSMAGVFFELVAEMRGGKLTADAVRSLDAGVFHGMTAVSMGLADSVQPIAALLANIGKGSAMADDKKKDDDGGGSAFETARAALEEAAKGDDANAAAAKRALAALNAAGGGDDDDSPAEPGDESMADEDEDDPKAESDDEKKKAESDDDKKKAESGDDKKEAANAYGIAARAMTKVKKLEARLAAADSRERDALLASRPDFTAEHKAVLRKAPLATVRELVKPEVTPVAAASSGGKPRAGERIVNPRAESVALATRGDKQGDGTASQLPPDERRALDIRMGLRAQTPAIVSNEYKLQLGVLVDAEPSQPNNPSNGS